MTLKFLKSKEVWKWFFAILIFFLFFMGVDWIFCAIGSSPLHTHLICSVAFLLHLYVLFWGSCQPLPKKRNWVILGILLFLFVCYIYWIGWLCDLKSSFDSEGWHLQSTQNKYESIDWPYWGFALNVIFFAVMIIMELFVTFSLLTPNHKVQAKVSPAKATKGLGLFGTIGAAMFLDDHLNRKKKHDHKLGSYWSDHDDDGNYDPGAWRRKYDRH